MIKKQINYLPILILFCHFIATSLYLAPINPLSKYYLEPINRYMDPLFRQHWALFAPEPATSSLQLHIRCQTDDAPWLLWMDPFQDVLSKHHSFRITYHGRLYHLMYGPIRDFHNAFILAQSKSEQLSNEKLESLNGFSAIVKIASHCCKKVVGVDNPRQIQAQFRIWQKSPPNYSTLTGHESIEPTLNLIFESTPRLITESQNV